MTEEFTRFRCWQPERIGKVINKLALSVDRAEFLATHVPMRHIAYEKSPQQMRQASESSLLDELNAAAEADRHVFAVVKGIPGTGKSHLIRWLKEQYVLAHPRDAVLLIARARTSLRDTIEQIIASGIFSQEELPQELQRLQHAVEILGQEALAERLINGLQEAAHRADWEGVQTRLGALHSRIKLRKVESFLLDERVRELLKREDGPIDRIVRFLTAGTGQGGGIERLPGFKDSDFEFADEDRRRLQGYQEVREFTADLVQRKEIREDLARYLNFELHDQAIAWATDLRAGDVLSMFDHLRRRLREQGRELTLFIEDITALTGISAGLIEVLVTDHGGEAGAGLARLTSVVGVADAFYADLLPTNIKDRITHVLTLNAEDRQESDLISKPEVRAEFAGRYLNALRVPAHDLRQWADRGALPSALPNGCVDCAFRQACHAAFGFVQLQEGDANDPASGVGLYPFSQQALNSLYDFLKSTASRTPRTFLSDLLAYILQSHGDLILTGEFPPPQADLAPSVNLPSFDPPPHRTLIEKQGGRSVASLATLILFWGQRHVYSEARDGSRTVGGLGEEVFKAFSLPMIEGWPREKKTGTGGGGSGDRETGDGDGTRPDSAPPVNPLTQRINDWANNGRLYEHNVFTSWLADLARSFVDWQSYGISLTQVSEYVTGRRFVIDGQSGAVTPGLLHLRFERSSMLRDTLQALADLNYAKAPPTAEQYGEHLATISYWIRSQEQRIVAFVREPAGFEPPADYLLRILLQNCVALACLAGELTPTSTTNTIDLYQQVVASCARSAEDSWRVTLERQHTTHPTEWTSLMRRLDVQKSVHVCRTELLNLLNRPQGASTAWRYLDAAAALGVLADFNAAGWRFGPLPIRPESNDRTWSSSLLVHDELEQGFAAACTAAQDKLNSSYERLCTHLGETPSGETFKTIRTMLDELRQVRAYTPRLDAPFSVEQGTALDFSELPTLLEEVSGQLLATDPPAVAAGLSARFGAWYGLQKRFVDYLDLLDSQIQAQGAWLVAQVASLRKAGGGANQHEGTRSAYQELIDLLAPFTAEGNR